MKENTSKVDKAIKMLTEKIEKETGKKVIFEAKDEEPKAEKKDTKIAVAVKAPKDAAATNKPTLGNIMPESSVMLMREYLESIFADTEAQLAELRTVENDITKDAQSTGEDYYKKIEKAQFNLKQIARVAQYATNTIQANKFDKALLDMILNNKQQA